MLWLFLWLSMSWAEQLNYKVKEVKRMGFQGDVEGLSASRTQFAIQLTPMKSMTDRRKPTRYALLKQLNKEVVREVNRWARAVNIKPALGHSINGLG